MVDISIIRVAIERLCLFKMVWRCCRTSEMMHRRWSGMWKTVLCFQHVSACFSLFHSELERWRCIWDETQVVSDVSNVGTISNLEISFWVNQVLKWFSHSKQTTLIHRIHSNVYSMRRSGFACELQRLYHLGALTCDFLFIPTSQLNCGYRHHFSELLISKKDDNVLMKVFLLTSWELIFGWDLADDTVTAYNTQ